MGRPRKDDAERAVQMHLPRWAFELVDEHVRGRAAAALFTMGEKTGPTQRELAAARSAYIASLIEAALGWEARHRTSVTVSAPALGDATSMRQAAEWLRKTEAALTESAPTEPAPAPVKAALEANRTMHELRAEAEGEGTGEEATILGDED